MNPKAPDKETALNLRRWWFYSVYEISDIVLQRRTWCDLTNRNPHWSYIEFVCSYPADDQLQYAKHWGFLSTQEFEILQELRNALVAHKAPSGNDYDNAAILDDPAWHTVAALAERTRQQLLVSITDMAERQALMGLD